MGPLLFHLFRGQIGRGPWLTIQRIEPLDSVENCASNAMVSKGRKGNAAVWIVMFRCLYQPPGAISRELFKIEARREHSSELGGNGPRISQVIDDQLVAIEPDGFFFAT
jgi:hypothetical protein